MTGSHRSPRASARRVILLAAPFILVASMIASAHFFGPEGSLYPLWVLLLLFVAYAATHLPDRYRRFGLGQINQAADQRFGRFGGTYEEDLVDHCGTARAGRNEPCPCGSGLKYKHCCLERDLHENLPDEPPVHGVPHPVRHSGRLSPGDNTYRNRIARRKNRRARVFFIFFGLFLVAQGSVSLVRGRPFYPNFWGGVVFAWFAILVGVTAAAFAIFLPGMSMERGHRTTEGPS